MGGRTLDSICHANEPHAYLINDSSSPDIFIFVVLTNQ